MKKKELELENKILSGIAQQLADSMIKAIQSLQKMRLLNEAQNELIAAQNKLIGELRSDQNAQKGEE